MLCLFYHNIAAHEHREVCTYTLKKKKMYSNI